jgi:GNAT superfamily N-acetyltransferase
MMEDTEGFDIEQSLKNYRNLLNDAEYYILTAKNKNELLGLVSFTTRKTLLHPAPCGMIDELIVSKHERGKGIGKQLILAAIGKCRQLGCCEVEVSTEKSNSTARRFYRSCGFEEDAVLLERDLE